MTCGNCLRAAPRYSLVFSPYRYRYPLDWLIHELKFGGRLAAARLLGELLARRLQASGQVLPELLIPVPLHRTRLRERGFNQALVLARILSRELGIPVDSHCCRRVRATPAQSSLPAGGRRRNVRGAFTLHGIPQARHVAIVDDVVTTGHTVNELAAVLGRGGVERIDVWSCVRAGE